MYPYLPHNKGARLAIIDDQGVRAGLRGDGRPEIGILERAEHLPLSSETLALDVTLNIVPGLGIVQSTYNALYGGLRCRLCFKTLTNWGSRNYHPS
jgi:hypothetical protein